ncbi:ankyrin repeat domain-containing protein [Wolbachia endosymbiont (group A) of Crataerina pallida]|uniref:ankyrin repeat domain-containing protein n=1 Tax=Wolbachia endosymbiont (group A) of Crataerina pallida TaxID=3066144 RepID=UPI0033413A97
MKLNNDLLLLSDRGALSISDYYSSVHKNWDLSIGLNNRIMEPEEFGERADEFSSFRYYKPDEQGLQIYHNQPVNKNDIGLVDLKDKSILDFNMRVINDTLLLSHKNNTLVKVENWKIYQPAREMMFAFNDAIVSNSKCIASICNSEDVIVEFNKEKAILSTEQLFDAVRRNNLSEVENLLSMGADVNIRDKRSWAPLHCAADNDNKLDISRAILNRNADIEARTNIGETPLHIANAYGQLKIIELLVDKGASLEAKTNDGLTPLHVAIQHNNTTPKIIEFLIDKGINIEAKTKDDWTPLHYAVFKDRLDIVRVLSSRGANIEAKTNDGKTPLDLAIQGNYTDIVGFLKQTELDKKLLTATENGDLSEVKKFVGQGANVNAIDVGIFGREPIHIAAEKNYKDIIEFLLGKGVSVDDTSNYGWAPLHYTASKGCLEVAKFLVDKGANINPQNVYGREPVHIAAEHDNKNIIELLLNKGVSVNEVDKDGWMSLHWASWNGHLNIIEYLVGKGANVNAKDRNGKTPLDLARDKGYNNVVEYLQQTQLGLDRQLLTAVQGGNLNEVKDFVVRGASLDTQDSNNGWTPIIYAAQGSKWDAVKFLIAQGAKFNNEITYQGTPLHFAAQEGNSNMVQFLLDKGADIEAQNAYNKKPLHLAVEAGKLKVVRLLLDRGANIKAADMYGQTPLDLAIKKGYENIVEVLKQKQLDLDKELLIAAEKGNIEKIRDSIRQGANVNVQGRQGWTPLFWAIQKNNFNIIELLLDNNADIKVKDNEGWTPLHWAVQLGSLDIVERLVERGADVNASTADGRTPLDIARDQGYNNIVNYLKEELNKEREKPVQRRRRHHHGDHARHHMSRKPLAIDSSNQPEIAASSGTRPSSLINDLFGWVKSSIGGLLGSRAALPEKTFTQSSISQISAPIDVNGTIMLLDLLIRSYRSEVYFYSRSAYISTRSTGICIKYYKGI